MRVAHVSEAEQRKLRRGVKTHLKKQQAQVFRYCCVYAAAKGCPKQLHRAADGKHHQPAPGGQPFPRNTPARVQGAGRAPRTLRCKRVGVCSGLGFLCQQLREVTVQPAPSLVSSPGGTRAGSRRGQGGCSLRELLHLDWLDPPTALHPLVTKCPSRRCPNDQGAQVCGLSL